MRGKYNERKKTDHHPQGVHFIYSLAELISNSCKRYICCWLRLRLRNILRDEKSVTFNVEKEPTIAGKLQGIRGQYLLIRDKALNIRKYSGFGVLLEF